MEKRTIKQYAIKHKLSIYQVVKLVKSGKLKTESVKEDGKESIYILDDETSSENTEKESSLPSKKSLPERVDALEREVLELKKRINLLLKKGSISEL